MELEASEGRTAAFGRAGRSDLGASADSVSNAVSQTRGSGRGAVALRTVFVSELDVGRRAGSLVPVFRDAGELVLDRLHASRFGRSVRPCSADARRAHARSGASTRERDCTLRFSTAGNPEKA